MGNFLKLLPLLSLLNDLTAFIKEAQAIYRGPGNNTTKLQHVIDHFMPLVQEAMGAGLIPAGIGEAIVTGAPAIISLIVQIMKATGSIDKPSDRPVETPAPSQPPSGSIAPYDDEHPGSLPSDAQLLGMGFVGGDQKWQSTSSNPPARWIVSHPGGAFDAAYWNLVGTIS